MDSIVGSDEIKLVQIVQIDSSPILRGWCHNHILNLNLVVSVSQVLQKLGKLVLAWSNSTSRERLKVHKQKSIHFLVNVSLNFVQIGLTLLFEGIEGHLVEETLRLLQKSILSHAVNFSSFLLLLVAVVNEFGCQFLENFEVLFIELSFKSRFLFVKKFRE